MPLPIFSDPESSQSEDAQEDVFRAGSSLNLDGRLIGQALLLEDNLQACGFVGSHDETLWEGASSRRISMSGKEDGVVTGELKTTTTQKAFEYGSEEEVERVEQVKSSADEYLRSFRETKKLVVDIPQSTLVNPRSRAENLEPPLPVTRESTAVDALLRIINTKSSDGDADGLVEFELNDFCVYTNEGSYAAADRTNYPYEIRPLQQLCTKLGHSWYFFDGILSVGDHRFYMNAVPFQELPIGNYEPEHHTVGDQIWIRSKLNKSREVYYHLGKPSTEYARFHGGFLWIADLAKHTINFCEALVENKRPVSLYNFRAEFSEWVSRKHDASLDFNKWYRQNRSADFRGAVVANVEFIYKEVAGVLGLKIADSLQLFREIRTFNHIPSRLKQTPKDYIAPTTVTPYIYSLFRHMKSGVFLKSEVSHQTSRGREGLESGRVRIDESVSSGTSAPRSMRVSAEEIQSIQPGDIISTHKDSATSGTKWTGRFKGNVDDGRWFACVQKVHINREGERSFDVVWLYKPEDTACCDMKYPHKNELFMSDHCSCEEGRDARIDEDEVLFTHKVEWLGNDGTQAEFFIRLTYMIEDRQWVRFDQSHLTCEHQRSHKLKKRRYRLGDTVLVDIPGGNPEFVEPCVVISSNKDGKRHCVRLRRLLRRKEVDPTADNARPNELVYTERFIESRASRIKAKCLVRFFTPSEEIHAPYDRGGCGNAFYITHQERVHDGASYLEPFNGKYPTSLRQGFDPKKKIKKLRALELFCGGGNFARGLEEGGGVDVKYANDLSEKAIHTYMANLETPDSVTPFLGSVDDLLSGAINGSSLDVIPRPGTIDFIFGGSPCQGFSHLNAHREKSGQAFKNQSLIASFASFVDVYRPKFGLLENVPTIVQIGKKQTDDSFSQLICAIVGMGYQTRIIFGDAWSYGAPQSRSRAFLLFAAPDQKLPDAPRPSHSHPPGTALRSFGKLATREGLGRRLNVQTPFRFVSAGEATADLPGIYDAKADFCAGFPDHRLSIGLTKMMLGQIVPIPTRPRGMNFAKAWGGGRGAMLASDRRHYPEGTSRTAANSKGWGRADPRRLFATVSTRCLPTDARIGNMLHWAEPRPLSVLETRRAQGFRDHEVLLGKPADQWKTVGNSVERNQALALGLVIREAWVGTLYDDDDSCGEARTVAAKNEGDVTRSVESDVQGGVGPGSNGESSDSDEDEDVSPPLPRVERHPSATPATSMSDISEAKPVRSLRKRPRTKSLAVELLASKVSRKGEPTQRLGDGDSDSGTDFMDDIPRKVVEELRITMGEMFYGADDTL